MTLGNARVQNKKLPTKKGTKKSKQTPGKSKRSKLEAGVWVVTLGFRLGHLNCQVGSAWVEVWQGGTAG